MGLKMCSHHMAVRSMLVLYFLFASAHGCGIPSIPPVLSRVVAGEDARPHSWPWQVSLQSDSSGRWRHVCGGTLISSEWVLTAAHCIDDEHGHRVLLGKHILGASEEASQSRSTALIIAHEDYNILLSRNDIALIKLASPVNASDTSHSRLPPRSGSHPPPWSPLLCHRLGSTLH
ncbi:hypothetical protein fugu_007487 [Takifugu bimaculatus]|uniref:Peptidase S1 domain-containing protein n=1 Tax=Takifugu bimaculatus TaxID=433685 RepID=A0A4Z2B537_9TELE|nr:hypothetical protein fugu_007487 [Takifugu bimaculatus]